MQSTTYRAPSPSIWRGPAYSGHSDLEPVRAEAARLDRRRRLAAEQLATSLLHSGRVTEAVVTAEGLVLEDPLAEAGWIALVTALAACGRQAEALRTFRRAEDTLAEVGWEASAALRAAEATALSGPPPTACLPRPGLVLSVPASSLVGRQAELREIDVLLGSWPLVTVVGQGGVGKTRLALEIARGRQARHELGCRVIELSRLSSADVVEDAVLAGLGLVRGPRSTAETLDKLGGLDLLIVLDNCEHLLVDVARLTERIIRSGVVVRVLATSRERLGIAGERVYPLSPLTSEPGGAARRLFLERAEAAGAAPPAGEQAVARILSQLDGLPLAIEMAASLLDAMTYAELADLLEGELGGLRSASRVAEARHETLAAAIEWSENLLEERERRVFAAFSVFAGPVGRADIEAVMGDSDAISSLRTLVTRSLVSAAPAGTVTLFRLLEPVRVLAGRHLTEDQLEQLRARHAEHFIAAAEQADRQLRTPGEIDGHERFEAIFDELRAAHRWARLRSPELAGRLTQALQVWSYMRGRDECLGWAELALDGPGADHPAILAAVATRASYDGRLDVAIRYGEAAIERAAGGTEALAAYGAIADACMYRGDLERAVACAREGADLASRLGDLHHQNQNRVNASLALTYLGRPEEALAEIDSLAPLPLGPTDSATRAFARAEALAEHDPTAALRCYEEAKRNADSVGSRFVSGVVASALVALQARHGDPAAALSSFAEVITYWRQTSNDVHTLTTLRNLPTLLQRINAAESCATVLGAVLRADISPTFGEEALRLKAAQAWAARTLGRTSFERAYRVGAACRTLDDAARTALQLIEKLRH